eukprot:Hpha_TRINITY_DN15959_c2_g14::TRINITY_DN15959_c2_g14_i1::g.70622::m.70622
MSCEKWFGLGCLVRETDSKEEAHIKRFMLPVLLFALVFSLIRIGVVKQGTNQMTEVLGLSIQSVSFGIFIIGVLCNAAPAGVLLDGTLGAFTVAMCLIDICMATRSSEFRPWVFIVLVLDAALVFQRDHLSRFILPLVFVHTTVLVAESVERFGLYDVGYWGSDGIEISQCNCASPPCPVHAWDGFVNWIGTCTVFFVDFYFTRGFATGLRHQLRVEASVEVAAVVTAALARYDLDDA